MKPSTIFESNTKGKIKELYESELTDKNKKNIINFAVGRCGKKYNHKNISKIYLNESEANFYAKKYNGIVHHIESNDFVDTKYDDDVFIENLFETSITNHFSKKNIC